MTAMSALKAEIALKSAMLAAIEAAVKAGLEAEDIKTVLEHVAELLETHGTEAD